MNKRLAVLSLGVALTAAAICTEKTASAQGALSQNSRRMGVTLNLGGSIGTGAGQFRLNPEFHYSFSADGMTGPGIGAGVDLYIPGFGIGGQGRFVWNFQPVSGLALLITPYGGLSLGGFFINTGFGSATWFYLAINFGAELRLIVSNRVFVGFRPLGFSIPIFIGDMASGAGFAYDPALLIGVTF